MRDFRVAVLLVSILVSTFLFSNLSGAADTGITLTNTVYNLGLEELIQRVLQRNESLQEKLLTLQVNRHKHRAEQGVFEPDVFATADREVNMRQNNTEQAAAASNIPVLEETNDNYSGGLEALIPTGARLKLGYNISDLRNNIPISIAVGTNTISGLEGNQWQTFFGVTVTQPLLKNFGPAATMAAIRVSAISSKIAYQEYRREMLTLISTAEATYWNLYLAQEQVHSFEESVKTAEMILRDNQRRWDAGMGSELEVLEARAGLGLRKAKLEEARQKVVETANRVMSLYAETHSTARQLIHAVDVPSIAANQPGYADLYQKAVDLNPDYLIQKEKIEQDLVRLGYARNQRLPEMDLKGAYGLNGLGDTPSDSWQNVTHESYPSWSVGLEFRVPITGGIKARNEFYAARLTLQASELELRSLQTKMFNEMDTAWHKLQSTRRTVESYHETVKYNESLLDSALARWDAGKIESRKVFEIEADLLDARNSVAESLVRDEIAHLELEVLEGVLLQRRNLEVSQRQLETVTRKFTRSALDDARYQRTLTEIQRLYQDAERPDAAPTTNSEKALRQKLNEQMQQLDMRDERSGEN